MHSINSRHWKISIPHTLTLLPLPFIYIHIIQSYFSYRDSSRSLHSEVQSRKNGILCVRPHHAASRCPIARIVHQVNWVNEIWNEVHDFVHTFYAYQHFVSVQFCVQCYVAVGERTTQRHEYWMHRWFIYFAFIWQMCATLELVNDGRWMRTLNN